MATISKHRDKWQCKVRKKGYPTTSKTFALESQARAWGKKTEADMVRGVYGVDANETARWTVSDLLDMYVREESKYKATGADDARRAKTIKRHLGAYYVAKVGSVHVADYKRKRLTKKSPQTVLHELNLLHRAYVIGVQDWGLVLPNGIPTTRRPHIPAGRERRASQAEIDQIIDATCSVELRVVILLALETAMRRSELLGLQWERVNLDKGTVLLDRTKNGSQRTVPLSRYARELLQPLRRDSGPVFSITAMSASRAFTRAVRRAGIKDLRFHDLRHEATSRLFEKGLNVIEVSRITGHKTLSMLNRYTHLDVNYLLAKLG